MRSAVRIRPWAPKMKIIVLNDTAYDEDKLEEFGIQFAIYYYENEGYEGLGTCLAYKDTKWYTCDLGHCSCYGPFEEFNLTIPFDTLKKAIRNLHRDDWSRYFDITIQDMHEHIKMYQKGTLFNDTQTEYVYLKNEM